MIADAGVLLAAADRAEPRHADCARVLREATLAIVPEPVVTQACYLIDRELGSRAEAVFLRSMDRPPFAVECSTREDRNRAADLIEQYADARLGFADCLIVAIAERLGENVIATLDRRDFTLIRPAHIEAFDLVP